MKPAPRVFPGWWIVWTGFLSQMVIIGATGFVFSVMVLPMSEDLGWSRSAVVGVLAIVSVVEGVVSVRLGPLVDRHGSRLLTAGSALLCGVCFLLISQVNQTWQYYACWIGIGLAASGLNTVGPRAAIANWFVRRRAIAFTIFSFGSATAGVLLAPLITWVNTEAGWRAGWQTMAVLAFAIVPLALVFIRRRPEDMGMLPDGRRPETGVTGPAAVKSSDDAGWTVREALRSRSYWLLVLGSMLIGVPASSIYVHMASYVAEKGYSLAAGATALGLYGLGTLVGRPCWGILIARFDVHRLLVAFGFIYGLGIVAFMLPSSLIGIYASIFVLGLSISPGLQLMAQVYPDYFGRRIVGTLLGYAGLALVTTRAGAPLMIAVTFDVTQSYLLAFAVCAACCFGAGVAFLLATPPVRRPVSGRTGLTAQEAD